MFYIMQSDERPAGWVNLSNASHWTVWLDRNIPATLDKEIRRRLNSNLKHLLVGLELKTALITPHALRGHGERPVLFESYFQNLILEFCVGAFSVLEGLGSAHVLAGTEKDKLGGRGISRETWLRTLCSVYDETGEYGLAASVDNTLGVRDKLHQDRIGARADIDWHALSYDAAFVPASNAIRTVLRRDADAVPQNSNLHVAPSKMA